MAGKTVFPRQWMEIPKFNPDGTVPPHNELVLYQVDMTFMMSTYRCTWGDGCQGVGKSHHGCCDQPAWMDKADVERIAPLADTLIEAKNLAAIKRSWFVRLSDDNYRTRTVKGKCIFLDDGEQCALHKRALEIGHDYRKWKPSVCANVPIHVNEDGDIFISNWEQEDWFGHNDWMCTAAPENYSDTSQFVYERFRPELTMIMGAKAYGILEDACDRQAFLKNPNGLVNHPVAVYITTKANGAGSTASR